MKYLIVFSIALVYIGLFNLSTQSDIQYKMVVSPDDSGDYSSIQTAIDAAKAFPDKRITIYVKNGIYREKIRIPSWNNLLSIIGEDVDKTIITWDDYFGKINRGRNSTFFTSTFLVVANDFYAENLTIENSAGEVGQAVALHVEGDRCVFKNCKILGNQDTLYCAGEKSNQLFLNCFINGTTDYIFGEATVLFEKCIIESKKDSYITAASTNEGKPFGFVFHECKITAANNAQKVFLGRPWRKFAKTVFISCNMGSQIVPEGWQKWSNDENIYTVLYAEYNNSGDGANTETRVKWSYQLNKREAKKYEAKNILGKWSLPYFPTKSTK